LAARAAFFDTLRAFCASLASKVEAMWDATEVWADIRPKSQERPRAAELHRAIAALAARQHGVVSRRELLLLGFEPGAITRLIGAGRLHPIQRGVYAVGHRLTSRKGRWMAAVLAGGGNAVLSHFSAAELWRLLKPAGRLPEVTIRESRRSRPGLRFHSSPLPADEVGRRDGIPVTVTARTLLDIAPGLTAVRLKSAVDAAEGRQLGGELSLADLLDRYPRRAGTAAIRRVLADGRIGLDVPREELELRFADVGGRWLEVDCAWRSARLVVELDSRAHHENSTAFEADRERDQALIAAGWRVMRVTWRQLHDASARIARDIEMALGTVS
jgi:predicted transcriptional regulator of viral defense system